MNAADAPRTPMPPWLEQAWLMRYLDRQLVSDEEAWFEAYLLDRPHLVEQLEADTQLRDALVEHGLDAAEPDEPAGHGHRDTRNSSGSADGSNTRRHRRRPPWLALAASFAAGIGLAWLGLTALSSNDSVPTVVANPTRIVFDTLRGEYSAPHIEPGDPNSPVILVDILIPPGATEVQAIVPGHPPIDLQPSVDGFATLVVPRHAHTKSIQVHYREPAGQNFIRQILDLASIPH